LSGRRVVEDLEEERFEKCRFHTVYEHLVSAVVSSLRASLYVSVLVYLGLYFTAFGLGVLRIGASSSF
jgi:hypothetical protein